jgi:putative acetyltransferase
MSEPRPVRDEDGAAVLSLIREVLSEYHCVPELDGVDRHLLSPGPFFRGRGGEFWVVEEAGRMIATAAVMLHPDSGELKCLYVHLSARRRGWGRRLTEMAVAHAHRAGRTRFILWTDTRFHGAHRLYERVGFQRFGVRELDDINHTREFGYARTLTPDTEEHTGGSP